MKITKRQLRRIIKEACELSSGADSHVEHPAGHHSSDVPSPADYSRVRDFLNQNSNAVDLGISMVMSASGAGCERSTAQGIIDHLKDKLSVNDPGPAGDYDESQVPPMMVDLGAI